MKLNEKSLLKNRRIKSNKKKKKDKKSHWLREG